ncbi:MAG: hypothetical protein HZB24_05225 [Desulfobacterales bacterium]|nr:hypothetical protein [Desulfobacterales bacterium]
MLDIAVAYNRYRFLGNEFLTWLWFAIETDMEIIRQCDAELLDLDVGNRMVLENKLANGKENITIKGDAAGLEEALLALSKGALITDLHLIYKSGSVEWQFAVKGESLSFSGVKLPQTGPMEAGEEMEGIILEKIFLYEKPFRLLDALYQQFTKLRLSEKWIAHTIPSMKKWISSSKRE